MARAIKGPPGYGRGARGLGVGCIVGVLPHIILAGSQRGRDAWEQCRLCEALLRSVRGDRALPSLLQHKYLYQKRNRTQNVRKLFDARCCSARSANTAKEAARKAPVSRWESAERRAASLKLAERQWGGRDRRPLRTPLAQGRKGKRNGEPFLRPAATKKGH